MLKKLLVPLVFITVTLLMINACKKPNAIIATDTTTATTISAVTATFGSNVNLSNLENYAAQTVPGYIRKDNTGSNVISNAGATLGRVLFYDKNLSVSNTIACASCHKQSMAFGDSVIQSIGVNGVTTRHSMRLVNARFAEEIRFFWDKRAATLQDQTIAPIQNHNEMGYSGLNGDQDVTALITKLQTLAYYKELFAFVYGDSQITQIRMQNALAQFIRSIQSFDSKFDVGMATQTPLNQNFPNFTAQENLGKQLFLAAPTPPGSLVSGAGCQACHRAPEFDADPKTGNNGVIGVAGSTTLTDVTNTNPPSLRNLVNANGKANGLYMHNGSFSSLLDVVNHYNQIDVNAANTNLDPRLDRGTRPFVLNLSDDQKNAIVAFLATLSGKDVYTNKKWGNPFLNQ